MPENLINPKSTLTGDTPIMKDVENWYFDLPAYNKLLKEYVAKISRQKNVRQLVSSTISEFLADPVVHIKNELLDSYNAVKDRSSAKCQKDASSTSSTSWMWSTANG